MKWPGILPSNFLRTFYQVKKKARYQKLHWKRKNKDRSNAYKLTKIGTVRILSLQVLSLKRSKMWWTSVKFTKLSKGELNNLVNVAVCQGLLQTHQTKRPKTTKATGQIIPMDCGNEISFHESHENYTTRKRGSVMSRQKMEIDF